MRLGRPQDSGWPLCPPGPRSLCPGQARRSPGRPGLATWSVCQSRHLHAGRCREAQFLTPATARRVPPLRPEGVVLARVYIDTRAEIVGCHGSPDGVGRLQTPVGENGETLLQSESNFTRRVATGHQKPPEPYRSAVAVLRPPGNNDRGPWAGIIINHDIRVIPYDLRDIDAACLRVERIITEVQASKAGQPQQGGDVTDLIAPKPKQCQAGQSRQGGEVADLVSINVKLCQVEQSCQGERSVI